MAFGAPLDRKLFGNQATSATRSQGEGGEYRASPDGSFLVNSVPICEIENMASADCDPYQQLEMCLWLPHHSNMTWQLGIVKDRKWMAFVPLRKVQDNESFHTEVLRGMSKMFFRDFTKCRSRSQGPHGSRCVGPFGDTRQCCGVDSGPC